MTGWELVYVSGRRTGYLATYPSNWVLFGKKIVFWEEENDMFIPFP